MTDEMPTLDAVLDAAMRLPPAHQQTLMEILEKRQIEMRRDEIASRAREAKAAYRAGSLMSEKASRLVERLHAAEAETEDDE